MGHAYQFVGWNRQKRIYDLSLGAILGSYLVGFVVLGALAFPTATAETLLIRALGSAAFLMLHVILVIGPLHRLIPSVAPLLYNRRHFGVAMFVIALAHGVLSTFQFHALGTLNPLVSILSGGGAAEGSETVPFQTFGFLALVILFLMAATSHDFWQARLSPWTWKKLHLSVYGAYVLLVAHVAFGIGHQPGSSAWIPATAMGVLLVGSLHVAAGLRERARDREIVSPGQDGFVRVGRAEDIQDGRAVTISLAGERVAVYRYGNRVSAISNVCRHQGGPLGEGRIVNGCVVCPWHGYEYDPATGCAPAPFTEKVPTFQTRVVDGDVWVHPEPNPAGTALEPSRTD